MQRRSPTHRKGKEKSFVNSSLATLARALVFRKKSSLLHAIPVRRKEGVRFSTALRRGGEELPKTSSLGRRERTAGLVLANKMREEGERSDPVVRPTTKRGGMPQACSGCGKGMLTTPIRPSERGKERPTDAAQCRPKKKEKSRRYMSSELRTRRASCWKGGGKKTEEDKIDRYHEKGRRGRGPYNRNSFTRRRRRREASGCHFHAPL